LGSAGLLVFLYAFSAFGVPLLLGGPRYATVEVEVYKERFGEGNGRVLATQGVLTYVAVNEKGEPVPVEAHAGTD